MTSFYHSGPRCGGIKKDGNLCKNFVEKYFQKCHLHLDQDSDNEGETDSDIEIIDKKKKKIRRIYDSDDDSDVEIIHCRKRTRRIYDSDDTDSEDFGLLDQNPNSGISFAKSFEREQTDDENEIIVKKETIYDSADEDSVSSTTFNWNTFITNTNYDPTDNLIALKPEYQRIYHDLVPINYRKEEVIEIISDNYVEGKYNFEQCNTCLQINVYNKDNTISKQCKTCFK